MDSLSRWYGEDKFVSLNSIKAHCMHKVRAILKSVIHVFRWRIDMFQNHSLTITYFVEKSKGTAEMCSTDMNNRQVRKSLVDASFVSCFFCEIEKKIFSCIFRPNHL